MRFSIRVFLLIMSVVALVVALTVSLRERTGASAGTPPAVPAAIQVPAGNTLFLVGHATGTQDYVCLPAGDGVKFVLVTPQATLVSDGAQVTSHYFSPNPAEGGTIRATWQNTRDTSTVWAEAKPGNLSADPAFVAPGAIPWVLLTRAGTQAGPDGGDALTQTTFVQRLNTVGGVAPTTGCSSSADVGHQAFAPYTADYFFYKQAP